MSNSKVLDFNDKDTLQHSYLMIDEQSALNGKIGSAANISNKNNSSLVIKDNQLDSNSRRESL